MSPASIILAKCIGIALIIWVFSGCPAFWRRK